MRRTLIFELKRPCEQRRCVPTSGIARAFLQLEESGEEYRGYRDKALTLARLHRAAGRGPLAEIDLTLPEKLAVFQSVGHIVLHDPLTSVRLGADRESPLAARGVVVEAPSFRLCTFVQLVDSDPVRTLIDARTIHESERHAQQQLLASVGLAPDGLPGGEVWRWNEHWDPLFANTRLLFRHELPLLNASKTGDGDGRPDYVVVLDDRQKDGLSFRLICEAKHRRSGSLASLAERLDRAMLEADFWPSWRGRTSPMAHLAPSFVDRRLARAAIALTHSPNDELRAQLAAALVGELSRGMEEAEHYQSFLVPAPRTIDVTVSLLFTDTGCSFVGWKFAGSAGERARSCFPGRGMVVAGLEKCDLRHLVRLITSKPRRTLCRAWSGAHDAAELLTVDGGKVRIK